MRDLRDMRMAVFNSQTSCGMDYTVHKKGNNELAILVLLTLLDLQVFVLDFLQPSFDMGYAVHTKGDS
jgi:hypothetical protein